MRCGPRVSRRCARRTVPLPQWPTASRAGWPRREEAVKKMTNPPWLAIWLLTRRLSAEWCDFVIGDLEEEFARRSGDSAVAAHAWFWWQTMRCLAAPPPVRPNSLVIGSPQGDSRMRTLLADLH